MVDVANSSPKSRNLEARTNCGCGNSSWPALHWSSSCRSSRWMSSGPESWFRYHHCGLPGFAWLLLWWCRWWQCGSSHCRSLRLQSSLVAKACVARGIAGPSIDVYIRLRSTMLQAGALLTGLLLGFGSEPSFCSYKIKDRAVS